MLRRLYCIAVLAFSLPLYALAQSSPAVPAAPILPTDFAGWHQTAPPNEATTPETADASNAAVLNEYGFKKLLSSDYTQGSNKLALKAFRFGDATGAYGAFTFYRQGSMRKQEIGSEGASSAGHFLFWTGVTLVDATFDHPETADVLQLRQLADALPKVGGPNSIPPSLPRYLPTAGLHAGDVHYAEGPVAYTAGHGVLPPDVISFDRDAEAVAAGYSAQKGTGQLTLLSYPTPQIAAGRERAIRDLMQSSQPSLHVRRNGPLIAVTSGDFTSAEADKLLDAVRYDAGVTWNHPEGYVSEANKAARLVVGIIYLVGILGGVTIFLGLFFGGGRAIYRRMRGKPVSTLNDEDFISLKLR